MSRRTLLAAIRLLAPLLAAAVAVAPARAAPPDDVRPAAATLHAGLGERDITPGKPVWLSGYAARSHPSSGVAARLKVQALALRGDDGLRVVLVALDNCEVTREFMAPILRRIESTLGLPPEAVIVSCSHTHSAPVLRDTLPGMFSMEGEVGEAIRAYSDLLGRRMVEAVGDALRDLSPARLARGTARAGFAMNRRVYRGGRVAFGENPEGPVDHDVPIVTVRHPDGRLRAILFGYACHGTTIGGSSGDDFYAVSGDYMGYARDYLEDAFPGARALYLAGCGADINPAPRGSLDLARRHGLELAGAVAGALGRPLRPVRGRLRLATDEVALPLEAAPSRDRLEEDAASSDRYVRNRARRYLAALDRGAPRPETVQYPVRVVRVGGDLTMVALAGEVVIDYALRLRRELAVADPWVLGYTMEVPCYIPSQRILLEGGYEADQSLVYYGIYGPLRPEVEDLVVATVKELVERAATPVVAGR